MLQVVDSPSLSRALTMVQDGFFLKIARLFSYSLVNAVNVSLHADPVLLRHPIR